MSFNLPLAIAMIVAGNMLGEAIVLIWQIMRDERKPDA
jgi:hypothetical protein